MFIRTMTCDPSTTGITLIESIEMILIATKIQQVDVRPLILQCFLQLRNKWAYRVRQHHPRSPRKPIPHPTTGATREFSTLPLDVVDEFMPVWVAWALQKIELNLRNQAEEIARYLDELDISNDAMEAVGQEAETADDDPE